MPTVTPGAPTSLMVGVILDAFGAARGDSPAGMSALPMVLMSRFSHL
jgi:hypothetical protein